MGTNYYWKGEKKTTIILAPNDLIEEESSNLIDEHPLFHIGKSCILEKGESVFIWAQDKQHVIDRCSKYLETKIIVNEYGDEFTGKEFIWLVDGCPNHDKSMIGKRFF